MWEDHSNSIGKKIFRAFLVLVAIGLAALLIVAMKYVRNRDSSDVQELQNISVQNQKDQEAARAELLNRVEKDYAQDLQTVSDYCPGIVFWGDKITGGTEAGVSFASSLQTLIDENICDSYDFLSTLDYADSLSRVDWSDYTIEIPVVNMGTGEESSSTILGRNGAVPYVLKSDIVIPAGAEPVQVSLVSSNGNKVAPLTAGNGGVNPVTIAGIEGTLTLVTSNQYTFTRLEEGTETEVPAGMEVTTAASSLYRNDIPVVLIGSYGDCWDDVDELVEQNKQLLDHQTGEHGRYIVLGAYTSSDSYLNNTYYYSKYEKAMERAFGERFINLREYLISDAATDLGISLTENDLKQIKNGAVPDSLRSAPGSMELKAVVYQQIGRVIYDRMDQLGYFSEIKTELSIKDQKQN